VTGSSTITASVARSLGAVTVQTFRVVCVVGPDAGREARSKDGRIIVGTAEDAELRLGDPTVSGYHLEIEATAEGLLVQDLRSKNGTRLGATWIREVVVRDAIELDVGDSRVRIIPGEERVALPASRASSFGGLIGSSPMMRAVYHVLESAAPAGVPVLISGESGTGKELAARALHTASTRAGGPFEVVDCGGLAPTLIESELFGHERGAFTGADRDRAGAFERAHGGTLFLDELGELPLALQPKLLRALAEGEVRRIGSSRPRRVDVRVVAATNREVRREINAGTFRADLYYRLAVVQLRMPPLRAHLEDLPVLVASLLQSIDRDTETPIDVDIEQLYRHSWPGNVRELRNYLHQLVVLRSPPPLDDGVEASGIGELPSGMLHLPMHKALARFEAAYLARLLERSKGNVAEAARRAGLNRASMYRAIQRHGLKTTE
jgi:two-component system, NtrC family, response regulator GlrR